MKSALSSSDLLPAAAAPQRRRGDRVAGDRLARTAWIWPVLVALAALLGSLGSADAPAFYAQLDQPAWAPPASWFGPVWTLLYLLMAVAAWRAARSKAPGRPAALAFFAVQLAANALWSWCFFVWHSGAAAAAVLACNLVLLVACAALFGRLRRSAGIALWPAIAWVAFAGVLLVSVWLRNPALLGAAP